MSGHCPAASGGQRQSLPERCQVRLGRQLGQALVDGQHCSDVVAEVAVALVPSTCLARLPHGTVRPRVGDDPITLAGSTLTAHDLNLGEPAIAASETRRTAPEFLQVTGSAASRYPERFRCIGVHAAEVGHGRSCLIIGLLSPPSCTTLVAVANIG